MLVIFVSTEFLLRKLPELPGGHEILRLLCALFYLVYLVASRCVYFLDDSSCRWKAKSFSVLICL